MRVDQIDAQRFLQPTSVAEAAVIVGHQEARETKREARKERREAQKDTIQAMKDKAAKLHEIADSTRNSAILSGITGLLSAGAQIGAGCTQLGASGITDAGKLRAIDGKANLWNCGAKVSSTIGSLAPYRNGIAGKEAEVQALDTEAARHEHRAQRAADRTAEASRLLSSYARQHNDLLQAQNAAAMAALGKG